jgi:hypothetical protein
MAKRPRPPQPMTARDLWLRIALYVVSISLWLVLVLFSNNWVARVCGVVAGVLNVLILAGYIRRYRALPRSPRSR